MNGTNDRSQVTLLIDLELYIRKFLLVTNTFQILNCVVNIYTVLEKI